MIRILACGRWTGARAAALEGLRSAGFEVQVPGNGSGPIECVVGPVPDLLLFAADDGGAWEGNALSLVRRIHPRLPLVVVTADGSVQERLRLAAVSPSYVAVDPIETGELCDAIADLVGPEAEKRHRPR
jgi:CheY-like chemotaxis protein